MRRAEVVSGAQGRGGTQGCCQGDHGEPPEAFILPKAAVCVCGSPSEPQRDHDKTGS